MKRLAWCGSLLLVILQVSCGGRAASWLDSAVDRGASKIDTSIRRDGGMLVLDQRPWPDAAVNHSLFIALFVDTIMADCMPMVPPDPVMLTGHVEAMNNGTIPVGPIQLTSGRLVEYKTGIELGTFALKPIDAHVVKPGEGLSAKIEKVAGSLTPNVGCQICGKMTRVEIAYAGAGLPAGAKVLSDPVTVGCAY